MPWADESLDWQKEAVLGNLRLGRRMIAVTDARAREARVEYGRLWAAALDHVTRAELEAQGFEAPELQCGRNPEKLKAMTSRPPYGPPETHPSLLGEASGD